MPLLWNVVVSAALPHRTVEVDTKPLPVTVSVKPLAPNVTLDGDKAPATGTGLSTVKSNAFDVPPPGAGLTTFTDAVPPAATSAELIAAVTSVPLTKVVVRVEPFHSTTAPGTNWLPVIMSVKAPLPETTLAGESDPATGAGLSIVNAVAPEVPPPGAGVITVTFAVPGLAISAAVMEAVSELALP
jgi:hypothetical protein